MTLPVEFDASARAKQLAFANGIVLDSERQSMARVLNAKALTYVAAAVSTLLTLLYFLLRSGLLGGRRDWSLRSGFAARRPRRQRHSQPRWRPSTS